MQVGVKSWGCKRAHGMACRTSNCTPSHTAGPSRFTPAQAQPPPLQWLTTDGTNCGCGTPSPAAASNTLPVPSPTTARRTAGRPAAFQPSINTEAASGEVMHTQSKSADRSARTCGFVVAAGQGMH